MTCEIEHHGIVIVDIAGFGRLDLSNTTRILMREALYRIFHEGLRDAAIGGSERVLKDLGDGILALFAPHLHKCRLIHHLIPLLLTGLEAYNREVAQKARMRVRVVVHAGEVVPHSIEHIGEDLNHAFRLLDSRALRRQLTVTEAPLVLIVSQLIYDGVVKHGYCGIDPGSYEPVRITVKETRRASAWIWTPHCSPRDRSSEE